MYTATFNLQVQPAFERAEGLIAPFVVSFRGNNGLEVKRGLIALMALLALIFLRKQRSGRGKRGAYLSYLSFFAILFSNGSRRRKEGMNSQMYDQEKSLARIYKAFNRRDTDTVLAAMHPAVDWPNGWREAASPGVTRSVHIGAASGQCWILTLSPFLSNTETMAKSPFVCTRLSGIYRAMS